MDKTGKKSQVADILSYMDDVLVLNERLINFLRAFVDDDLDRAQMVQEAEALLLQNDLITVRAQLLADQIKRSRQ